MPRPKPDPARVARARHLHGLGLDTRSIAKLLDIDPKTVQRWTRDQARPRGARKRPDVPDDTVLGLRDQDQATYRQMAEETGMSETGVRNRYYSLTGRPRAERQLPRKRDQHLH